MSSVTKSFKALETGSIGTGLVTMSVEKNKKYDAPFLTQQHFINLVGLKKIEEVATQEQKAPNDPSEDEKLIAKAIVQLDTAENLEELSEAVDSLTPDDMKNGDLKAAVLRAQERLQKELDARIAEDQEAEAKAAEEAEKKAKAEAEEKAKAEAEKKAAKDNKKKKN